MFKYTLNEQEFSTNHLPNIWQELFGRMMHLIEKLSQKAETIILNAIEYPPEEKDFITVKLPEAMPLSCDLTHLHKFDNIETTSEPKIIYLNSTWHK